MVQQGKYGVQPTILHAVKQAQRGCGGYLGGQLHCRQTIVVDESWIGSQVYKLLNLCACDEECEQQTR